MRRWLIFAGSSPRSMSGKVVLLPPETISSSLPIAASTSSARLASSSIFSAVGTMAP